MSDSNKPQPGWYYAPGDPAGTNRYWDGELWQGEPVPAAGTAAPMATGYGTYPEASQSTLALVMAILGLVLCGILGPVGWYLGQQELDGIDSGVRDPSNRGTAQAAKVIGIIATVFVVLGLAFILFFFVIAGASLA